MIGILVEKNSAGRNFAASLGGTQGTYNGEPYMIVPARGHLYEFNTPEVQVPDFKQWSLPKLPWDETRFDWKRTPKNDTADCIKNIKSVLSQCSEICIATDDDPTGEGELLAWEILDECGFKPQKWSRMFFLDESAKEVQKAFVNRKPLASMMSDPDYIKAFYRMRWDFLSMQFTRIATLAVNRPQTVLRQGRLKSAMVLIVGDQLKAISEYKKIPSYSNRFRDENSVVYTSSEEPEFPNKDDVPNIYAPSPVTIDSKTKKASPPPKLIDLATLAGILAGKGFASADVLTTYQKLYESTIVSYPRTDDKVISPEQFNDLLPKIDQIAAVVGVDVSLLTHRTPRSTHVKTGGAHGANRPGPNVPSSLQSLSSYGACAPAIYELLAKNYLAMLGEDYEYEAQVGHVTNYPKFIGRANVPLSMGYKKIFSDMDEPDEDDLTAGLGTKADPFIYEGFPPKPQYPTMSWLMKQLEKRDVGTGATRTNIYSEVTNQKASCPLLLDKKGKISMTEFGDLSYAVLPGTNIGNLDMTEKVMGQMKLIAKGQLDPEACLREIKKYVEEDIVTMQANVKAANITGGFEQKEKATGIFNGQSVSFSREWAGHKFTDAEVNILLAGGELDIIGAVGKTGTPFDVKGKLTEQEYKGKKFFGFEKIEFINQAPQADKFTGLMNGKPVSFKRSWGGHDFTDEECRKLLAGEELELNGLTSQSGSTYGVTGKLTQQTYKGKKFFGFEKTGFAGNAAGGASGGAAGGATQYPQKEKYNGKLKGKDVSFNRTWGGHTFTDQECQDLCDGKEITVTGLKSTSGSTYGVKGKLKKQSFKGKEFYGFDKTDFI